MYSVLERLVDASLDEGTSGETGSSSREIVKEIDAASGKCVYGWKSNSRDSPVLFDFLDNFGGHGGNSQPQIPFYPNLAM